MCRTPPRSAHQKPPPMPMPPHRGLSWFVAGAASGIAGFCQSAVVRNARAIGGMLAVLTLACATFGISDSYRGTIRNATDDMQDLGMVLAEQASRSFQVIDMLLQDLQLRGRDLN